MIAALNSSSPSAPQSCRLCGSLHAPAEREQRGRYRYMQCQSCGLAFVANPPPEAEILAQYNTNGSSKLAYYRMAAAADARSFDRLLQVLERYTPRGRILDVGCNIGTFVRVARSRGWDATGVDVNEEAVDYGRRTFGLDLLTPQELERRGSDDFDTLHSSDTVEHFTDPVGTMREFASRVRPGGLLFVSTPNYDSRLCKLFQLKPTEHLFLFNPTSFTYFFARLSTCLEDILFFDRYRNISAMSESTTFDRLPLLQAGFGALHRIAPELLVRLPGRENIVGVARVERDADELTTTGQVGS